jgi:arsenical pump membrane protein
VIVAVVALVTALAVALAWRSAWAPAAGALLGVAIAASGGVVELGDIEHAALDLWQPVIAIVGIMLTTACAAELGIFAWLATWIEPRTRGPVRHAFRMVFVLSALTAALLSNDAAILLVTPVVIELLKTVYPIRHPKFALPFAFAVFVAAGVAPLPTGNPMNLVVASRAGIDLNTYALHMIPVAIAGWIVAYAILAYWFRDALADEAPALGGKPPRVQIGTAARLVLVIVGVSTIAYPVIAALGGPIWPVALGAAVASFVVAIAAGGSPRKIFGGVSWELLPFLFGVMMLATALSRTDATAQLAALYADSSMPLATIGGVSTVGSALINNHPMALVQSHALAGAPDAHVLAALVGGDLGPRLLPSGSLAGLLWVHALRRSGVVVPRRIFFGLGLVVTIPSVIVSLVVLRLVA